MLKRDPRDSMIYDMNRQAIDVRAAVVPEQETLLSSNQGPFSVNPFVTGFREQMAAWSIYQTFTPVATRPFAVPWWRGSKTKWTTMART